MENLLRSTNICGYLLIWLIPMGTKSFPLAFPIVDVRSTEPTPSASSRFSFDLLVLGRHAFAVEKGHEVVQIDRL